MKKIMMTLIILIFAVSIEAGGLSGKYLVTGKMYMIARGYKESVPIVDAKYAFYKDGRFKVKDGAKGEWEKNGKKYKVTFDEDYMQGLLEDAFSGTKAEVNVEYMSISGNFKNNAIKGNFSGRIEIKYKGQTVNAKIKGKISGAKL